MSYLKLMSLILIALATGCLQNEFKPAGFTQAHINRPWGEIYYTGVNNRNLVFLAADSFIQKKFSEQIGRVTNQNPPPRIEQLAWDRFSNYFAKIYEWVIRIPYDKVKHKNLLQSLDYMEEKDQEFDVFILSHGLPGHLTKGTKGYFISWRELSKYRGRWPHMRLVILQSCFGTSISRDWRKAGANYVISYPDLNKNFLFVDLYLRYLRSFPEDPPKAFEYTSSNFDYYLEKKWIYSRVQKELMIPLALPVLEP